MATVAAKMKPELLGASDAEIEDAVHYAEPMVLRGLLYQLTGDAELKSIELKRVVAGLHESVAPASEADVAMLRRKAADFLKAHRNAGAGPIGYGPEARIFESMCLVAGHEIGEDSVGLCNEEIALDPWARELKWREMPDPEALEDFSVTVIGTGMGGLNAALMLKRAGIKFHVIEKNAGVGGTWYENRYPGARVDTPSRMYTHIFGVDFDYPNAYCDHVENRRYFDWIADEFDLRSDISFETEVHEMAWKEADGRWEIRVAGPDGERLLRSNAVITAVGFLNRPNMPEIEGMDLFEGQSWHTSRWPESVDLRGKRVAVVGTGCTGYQLVPELARLDGVEITVFQRTPQWLLSIPNYLAPHPKQVTWLDRNLPFYANFMRFRANYRPGAAIEKMFEIDPEFDDPDCVSEANKDLRDRCIEFLKSKLGDPELVETMIPRHPPWSARPVLVDADYSILDALNLDNVALVSGGVARINRSGIETDDGTKYDFDVIVYATGFRANDYLYPMKITGKGGQTIEDLWAEGGARAYLGCMMPGFPNLWSLYGPNTNGGLPIPAFQEITTQYALKCIERLILEDKRSAEVSEAAYWDYNRKVDERNAQLVWSDPRAHNYYWSQFGRSVVMNPFTPQQMWHYLHQPDWDDVLVS